MTERKGNSRSVHSTLGARNYAHEERETDDYYATDPRALELLLKQEQFAPNVWECACGAGHLAEVLVRHGYNVRATDLRDRGYGTSGVDFLKMDKPYDGDIVTNPPYGHAQEFVEKALELITEGHKVCMFLKIQFLEGKARRQLFEKAPPRTVYVSTGRFVCAKNGDFERYAKANAVTYAWFIWEKGSTEAPKIKWFN